MHDSVMTFAQRFQKLANPPVIEIGSYNVNGAVRDLFTRFKGVDQYLGLDVVDGPGVDRVIDPNAPIPYDDGCAQTVISTECLEHTMDPLFLMREMWRLVAPGGLLLVTARGNGFGRHNPPDRWRVMPGTLLEYVKHLGAIECDEEEDPQVAGAFLWAYKPSVEKTPTRKKDPKRNERPASA